MRRELMVWARTHNDDDAEVDNPIWEAVWRLVVAEIEQQNAGRPALEVDG